MQALSRAAKVSDTAWKWVPSRQVVSSESVALSAVLTEPREP